MKRDNTYLIGNQHAKGAKRNKAAFKKGNVPWNKGLKGIHLSPDSEWKKGCKSNRHLEVGAITIRKHKRDSKARKFIKVEEPNRWIEHAKYVWSQKYGEIYKGDIIHHIDGDTLNDNVSNLIALPRADHPIFHSRWGLKQLNREQLAYYRGRYE